MEIIRHLPPADSLLEMMRCGGEPSGFSVVPGFQAFQPHFWTDLPAAVR